jgi:short-subunit dehydrogenase
MRRDFKGWTVLITGASAGLGREFARQLACEATRLVLVARRLDRLEQVKEDLLSINSTLQVDLLPYDISVPDQMVLLMNWCDENQVHADLLINNAGLGDYGVYELTDWKKLDQMLMVNIVALSALCRYFLPEMVRRKKGAIANISSIASFVPIPTFAVYAATKAYVTSFSEALSLELFGTGVTVTTICPGPIPTEFGSVAERSGKTKPLESPPWFQITAPQAVRESIKAIRMGKPCFVPGWIVRSISWLMRGTPTWVMRWIGKKFGKFPEKAQSQRSASSAV